MKVVFKAGRVQFKKVKCLVSIQTGLSIAKAHTTYIFPSLLKPIFKFFLKSMNLKELTLLNRHYYQGSKASSWYTRQQILSVFVCDYSKKELLNYLPGLSTWRIDEARKHANLNSPGKSDRSSTCLATMSS